MLRRRSRYSEYNSEYRSSPEKAPLTYLERSDKGKGQNGLGSPELTPYRLALYG